MQDDWADKTEAATPHKRAEARREGNVPRSADLTAAAGCVILMLLLRQTGSSAISAMKALMNECFTGAMPSTGRIGYLLGSSLLPLLIGLVLAGLIASLLQSGFILGIRKNSGALNPGKGLQEIFSGHSAVQMAMNLLKLALVAGVVFVTVRSRAVQLLDLIATPSPALPGAAGSLAFAIGIRVALALLAMGLIDYMLQRFRHERSLRMSRRELKDQLKQQEGDPALKRRRQGRVQARISSPRQGQNLVLRKSNQTSLIHTQLARRGA